MEESRDLFKICIQDFKVSDNCRNEINEYLKHHQALVKLYKMKDNVLELFCERNCANYHQIHFNVYFLVCVVVHNEAAVVSYTKYCYLVHNNRSYMLKFTEHFPARNGWSVDEKIDSKN